MEYIRDFLLINKQTIGKTMKSLKDNWIIIFTGIVYTILNMVILRVVSLVFSAVLYIIAGIILAIVSASLISNYLYLLFNIINYNKFTIQDFKDGFKYFLRKVYTVFFFAWIGNYILGLIGGILGGSALLIVYFGVMIAVFILLNSLPETLYLKSLEPLDSIYYAADFMKENWINWLLPSILFNIIIFFLTGNIFVDLFTTHLSFGLSFDIVSMGRYLLGQLVFSFMMIYRGHLFKLLSTSTRRKRMFMSKF